MEDIQGVQVEAQLCLPGSRQHGDGFFLSVLDYGVLVSMLVEGD